MSLKIFGAALIAAAITLPAQAATTIAGAYTRISPAQNIIAQFTSPTGATAATSFTGPVEVLVSGTGFSAGSTINDAFYFTENQQSLAGNFYHLGMSKTGGTFNTPATKSVEQFITFIDGVGAVAAGTIPAYAASNSYNFVIDAGAGFSLLSFGVLDGNFGDNGGQYNITLWQLAPSVSAVPESATWMMMIVGFGAIGVTARRRQLVRATA